MSSLTHLDLCAGIGGFALGFESAGIKTVGFVEKEFYCRSVLDVHWPHVPQWPDVNTLDLRDLPYADIITAGYPCQPFSFAGSRKGEEDDRHIWPRVREIIAHKRPAWAVLENVPGHISLGLDDVLADLEDQSYAARPFVVPAIGVDARHVRNRVWIIARNMGDTHSERRARNEGRKHEIAADTDEQVAERTIPKRPATWPTEPEMGRVAYGIPNRVDRIKALGNAIVPQVAMAIAQTILDVEAADE